MATLEVLTLPDPRLKLVSTPITDITAEIDRFVQDFTETMQSFRGCVGLAAPQVDFPFRIVAVDVSVGRKPHPNHGLMVMLNPVVTACEGSESMREGCLSVPDFTGNVRRPTNISLTYLDPTGKECHLDTEGFEARAILHEIDHLDGLLFLDRVSSLKDDVFRRKNYL
ncbi:MAG: peptide deformylase [Blastocatellia bacterium]|nr:peptide deformylase [Blastocatellia bacterium]